MTDHHRPPVLLTMLTALAAEAEALTRHTKTTRKENRIVPGGHAGGGATAIIQCGLGRDAVLRKGASQLNQTLLVGNIGVSGGLAPDTEPGTIIIGERILTSGDGPESSTYRDIYTADQQIIALLEATLQENDLPCRRGALLCVQQPITRPEDKAAAYLETGALAVDMESAGAAEAARLAGIPFFSIRVICDPARRKIAEKLFVGVDSRGNNRPARLIKPLIRRPWLLAQLLMMARDFSCALSSIERVWNVVEQPLLDLAADRSTKSEFSIPKVVDNN
jgi:adenosylhomocysteine nucleosidase